MKKKIIITSICAVLLIATAFKLKTNKSTVEANVFRQDTAASVLVQSRKVEFKNIGRAYTYTGTFAAYREVSLIAQTHGEVSGIYFHEGDVVKAGSLLLEIDDDLLQAQFASADATFKNAKRNYERYQNASVGGGVSQLQLDNLRVSMELAEAERKQIEKRIALCKIFAPFSGTITLRDVEPGSVVGSAPIARLSDLSKLKLEISVPEKEIALFKEGEKASIETDIHPLSTLSGKIDYVADRSDDDHNYTVRILVNNTDPNVAIKAGMYGTAVVHQQEVESLVIPRSALIGSAKNPQVFVVRNNQVILTDIQTGNVTNDEVEILSGLDADDTVVTGGHINLTDGTNVELTEK